MDTPNSSLYYIYFYKNQRKFANQKTTGSNPAQCIMNR